jgi:hypothetical protein
MRVKIEFAELQAMGATRAQLDTYSNSDPLVIYQTSEEKYTISGIVEAETDANGVLDILDALADPDC